MNYQESLEYLYKLGHETLAMKFGLENTRKLLAAFDDPHKSFIKIQIAGTNGKGSTAAFLDSICRRANLKTGLYTSPHLVSMVERIKINNQEIGESEFAKLTTEVRETSQKLIDAERLETLPTYFEHLTIIALLAFRRARVDVAILETGLGGRLDATTAAKAEIIGITSISLDHQEYLGNTITEIAREKAAIIRAGVQAVTAPQEPEVMNVILKQCVENSVRPLLIEKQDYRIEKTVADVCVASFSIENNSYSHIRLALRGRHQLENAATAIALAEKLNKLKFQISSSQIVQGLETARHTGRLDFQKVGEHSILFDGAHNRAGAKALKEFLQEFYSNTQLTIVFGAMRDKDLTEITNEIFPLAHNLILSSIINERSAAPEDLGKYATGQFANVLLAANAAEALDLARKLSPPEHLIVLTGSLYLVGEALKNLAFKKL